MIDLLKESPLQTASVVAVGTALYALYFSSKDKETDGFDKIPTPKGKYPYLGHLPLLGENMFLKIHEWHKELGPFLHVKMGVQDFIFISDPIIAHEAFNVNGSITTLRPPFKFVDGVFIIDQMGDVLQFETSYLINQLIKNGNTNEGVDPFHDIAFRSLNVVLRVSLGTRMDSTEDPAFKDIVDIMQLSLLYGSIDEDIDAYIPALKFISYIQNKDKRNRDFINNLRDPVLRRMIKEALERDVDCLVKRIKESEDVFNEDDMTLNFIQDEMIIGGTDTVSVSISWTFALLSHHPEIQRKICDEIDAFIIKYKRLPIFTEREAFPYMISVQREIMRFYPVLPYGLPHIAEQDFVVRNYMIKKGITLISDMYSMHRNPDVYPDPDKFIPERFINNKSTLYASANGNVKERDQRICPGIYLAETELFLAYTTLWARCTIEPALDSNGEPMYADIESFVDGGLASSPKPYKVRFVERPDKLL
ncbi:cytochrome P450 [Spinellus fusiger]|nr:cytochrome P450 [Spinellus fusiger]